MSINDKFQNKLHCICNEDVIFEIIDDIECDWGNHTVIQCPQCEELFSIDCECPAFQSSRIPVQMLRPVEHRAPTGLL